MVEKGTSILNKDKGIETLKNTCVNQNGEIVVENESTVRIPEAPA